MKRLFGILIICCVLTSSVSNGQDNVLRSDSLTSSPPLHKPFPDSDFKREQDSLNLNMNLAAAAVGGLELPTVVTTSPSAAQMLRFADYPVSHFTGTVDISIPIYTIEVNGISVPISLRYHTSGIKYDDVSTGVGLGWMLDAGGAVTYDANGMAMWEDSYTSNPTEAVFAKSKESLNLPYSLSDPYNDLDALLELAKKPLYSVLPGQYPTDQYYSLSPYEPVKDGEIDVFSYSFPGHSGKVGYRGDLGYFNFNDDPITFVADDSGYDPYYQFAQISDENGIKYEFEPRQGVIPIPNDAYDYLSGIYTYPLRKITSADQKDDIIFTYNTGNNPVWKPIINQTKVQTIITKDYGIVSTTSINNDGGVYKSRCYSDILTKIEYRGGSIEFTWRGLDNDPNTLIYLDKIVIKKNGLQIKAVYLEQSTFSNGQQKLNRVAFYDNDSSSKALDYDYEFAYNDLPSTYKIPEYKPGIDYWGYYNGQTWLNTYVPGIVQLSGASNGINRNPMMTIMKSGTLSKMTHPTGGYSTYTYEAHKAGGQTWGGLRIQKIDNYDSNGTLLYRNRYEYRYYSGGTVGEGTSGNNYYPSNPSHYLTDNYDVTLEPGTSGYSVTYSNYKIYGSFAKSMHSYFGSPVVYPHVTEYREGSTTGGNGRTEYTYSFFSGQSNYVTPSGAVADRPLRSYDYKNGKLLAKKVFNESGIEVYSLNNTYEDVNQREHVNLHAEKLLKFGTMSAGSINLPDSYRDFFILMGIGNDRDKLMDYYNYYSVCGRYVLKSSKEVKEGVATTTTYSYPIYPTTPYPGREYGKDYYKSTANQNVVVPFPSNKLVTYSDGVVLRTEYQYPYNNKTVAPYTTMVANNIISPVVSQKEFNGPTSTTVLSATETNYGTFNTTVAGGYTGIAPLNIKTLVRSGSSMETRVEYLRRDAYGNPQHVKEDGLNIVYLWSYKSQYPVIEVRGATYSQVESALGASTITSLANSIPPADATITSYHTTLRGALTTALVTAYTYKQGVGMMSSTDPSGRKTIYTYDTQNRLSLVTDPSGRVIEKYTYNYKKN